MKAIVDADTIVWAVGSVTSEEDPIQNVLHSVKLKLASIMDSTGCTEMQLYLTGDTNFRKEISPTYKANRTRDKPFYFDEIRKYMVDVYGAIVSKDCEADDYLGMAQTEETILVSIDKDLDQIPGRHYNPNKDVHYYITKEVGDRFFYEQLLMGDRADNIEGIRGVGPVKSKRILQHCKTNEEMACEVGLQYAIHFDDPEDKLDMNERLLWIMR